MIIIANWKAYVDTSAKAKKLFESAKKVAARSKHEIVLAPPDLYLGLLAEGNKSQVIFAGQDVSDMNTGAHTGEVTAAMLAGLGARYVIVGHSERRARGETDTLITQKVQQALAAGLTPVLCVGERERDAEAQYLKCIRGQISEVFKKLSHKEQQAVVIAYEPVWAIGKKAADAITSGDLREMVLYIRKVLNDFIVGKANKSIRIIYGGSAEAANVSDLVGAGIDGFLVGHASTDAATFTALIKALN